MYNLECRIWRETRFLFYHSSIYFAVITLLRNKILCRILLRDKRLTFSIVQRHKHNARLKIKFK